MSQAAVEAEALLEAGKRREAMEAAYKGLNQDPDDMALLSVLSRVVSQDQAHGLAYNLLKRSLSDPRMNNYAVLNNLGMAASSVASSSGNDKFLEEADGVLSLAYLKNRGREVTANLALVKLHKLELAAAEKYAHECLEQDPGNAQARETLGYVHLHRGSWNKGFGNYEFTLGGKYRDFPTEAPYWEPGMRGKRLLVRGEQGIGDEITYASVLEQAQHDNEITLDCDARLEGLFRRSFPKINVSGTRFTKKPDWGPFDAACLSGSLCMEYRQKDGDFPRSGFLVADPELRKKWRERLDKLPGRKIGLAWTGGLDNTFKHRRSLGNLEPLLSIPGISWVSLQYNKPGDFITHWPEVEKGNDYDEVAALVMELDEVVSVTTAIVHLCGALGKKCSVLVPDRCRWFYNSPTSRHRWYDSLTLYKGMKVDKLVKDLCSSA